MMTKNRVPDQINEVVDFPLPRKISPELSRKIEEEELYPKSDESTVIDDMIAGLRQGKPIPYGPDFDVNKTFDVRTCY
jgi:hypothetical protein